MYTYIYIYIRFVPVAMFWWLCIYMHAHAYSACIYIYILLKILHTYACNIVLMSIYIRHKVLMSIYINIFYKTIAYSCMQHCFNEYLYTSQGFDEYIYIYIFIKILHTHAYNIVLMSIYICEHCLHKYTMCLCI